MFRKLVRNGIVAAIRSQLFLAPYPQSTVKQPMRVLTGAGVNNYRY